MACVVLSEQDLFSDRALRKSAISRRELSAHCAVGFDAPRAPPANQWWLLLRRIEIGSTRHRVDDGLRERLRRCQVDGPLAVTLAAGEGSCFIHRASGAVFHFAFHVGIGKTANDLHYRWGHKPASPRLQPNLPFSLSNAVTFRRKRRLTLPAWPAGRAPALTALWMALITPGPWTPSSFHQRRWRQRADLARRLDDDRLHFGCRDRRAN